MIIMASINELSNLEQVKRLVEQSDILALQDNQPQLVILSVERYRALTGDAVPFPVIAATPAPSAVSATSADFPPSASTPFFVTSAPTETETLGALVRRTLRDYCARNRLPQDEVDRLCDLDYSSSTFIIPYPFLKPYNPAEPLTQQAKDERGYNRYYARATDSYPLTFYGEQYLLCNHWVEASRDKFEQWARRWE